MCINFRKLTVEIWKRATVDISDIIYHKLLAHKTLEKFFPRQACKDINFLRLNSTVQYMNLCRWQYREKSKI